MRIQNPIKHLRWSFKHLRQRKKLHNLKIKIFKQTKQSMTHYYLHLFDDKDTDSNLDETPWCIWKTYRSFSSCLLTFCVVCNTSYDNCQFKHDLFVYTYQTCNDGCQRRQNPPRYLPRLAYIFQAITLRYHLTIIYSPILIFLISNGQSKSQGKQTLTQIRWWWWQITTLGGIY